MNERLSTAIKRLEHMLGKHMGSPGGPPKEFCEDLVLVLNAARAPEEMGSPPQQSASPTNTQKPSASQIADEIDEWVAASGISVRMRTSVLHQWSRQLRLL